jgi:hypothetical protein
MGISVTRVVWINDDILELKGCHRYAAKWEVLNLFKRIPKGTHYTVRYTLDDHGPFVIVKKTIMVLMNIKTNEDMGVCFLPKTWDGKRVNRAVIVPIYENGEKL